MSAPTGRDEVLPTALDSLVHAGPAQLELELRILERANPGPALDLLRVALDRLRA
ncbi:hypothetical protein ABIB15_002136 [Marisediminicola sp. UYEF4]|uniref:hypothetical protein n=1 Tax=Marisediminicola sp. UYEF4 TaxID=1756384 RepID=UPI00339ACBD3